ncbi:MAG: Ion channel protein [Streptosporangiales bacterium]|nr:Ion channel protein [Streptosporangiales bacterium]
MARMELRLPQRRERPPLVEIGRRIAFAIAIVLVSAVMVMADHEAYEDSDGSTVGWLDAIYYATVSLSTTGYGDIVPVTPQARFFTIVILTPLRILFLIVLIGTTITALSERSRKEYRISRWKARVRNHIIICGFGTKGRAAARTLITDGFEPNRIVVIDPGGERVAAAQAMGLVAIQANAEQSETLKEARVDRARAVLITVHDDNSAVMIALTVRKLNKTVYIAASVREEENVDLLKQSGARSVITAQEAAGRLVGLAARKPSVAAVAEDLISYGIGLDLKQRPITEAEIGKSVRDVTEVVVAVVRGSREEAIPANHAGELRRGDQLVYIQFPDHLSQT